MPTLKYFDPTDGQYKKIGVPVGQAPAPVSGVFGAPPLDIYGAADAYGSDEQGQEIFKDRAGNLRARPQLIPTTAVIDINGSPSAYPAGMSIMCMSSADSVAKGWPGSGTVVTFRRSPADVVVAQWYYQNQTSTTVAPLVQFRSGNAANTPVWGLWVPLVTPPPAPTPDTGWLDGVYSDADWNDYGAGYSTAQYRKIGSQVYLRGLCRTAIARTGITTIFNLPVGYRPVNSEILNGVGNFVFISGAASTGTAHTHSSGYQSAIRCDVTSTGNVTVNLTASMNMGAGAYISLTGMRFFID